jgi:hypothetical protein
MTGVIFDATYFTVRYRTVLLIYRRGRRANSQNIRKNFSGGLKMQEGNTSWHILWRMQSGGLTSEIPSMGHVTFSDSGTCFVRHPSSDILWRLAMKDLSREVSLRHFAVGRNGKLYLKDGAVLIALGFPILPKQ